MSAEELSPEQEREFERLLALVNLQRLRGQLSEAEDTCRKALSINPGDASIREMLGDVLMDEGRLDPALCAYRAALEVSPGNPSLETKFAKATLAIAGREREKAVAKDMLLNPRKYVTRERSPLAAMMFALVPGMGQLYNGELVKAAMIFGTFLVFIIAFGTLHAYPSNVASPHQLLFVWNPVVLVLGCVAALAYIYGMIDAPITASKSSKGRKTSAEP